MRTKDELVSVVSHELRTPLASLVGFAELLLTRQNSEQRQRQFLSIIQEEGRRLTALINDFLDIQRLESGRETITPEPVEVAHILGRAAGAAGDDPEHPLIVDVEPGLAPVRADADRIHQVLTNLISNARKYSPAGGEVRVAARAAEAAVEISVTDQGLGIPPEALPRLFEKFYRIDNTDRRTIKGTGLGLAICHHVVAAHGGRIWAESQGLGCGSRFAFTLPLAEDGERIGDVLVIEDDAAFARLLEAELATYGLSAARVASVESALERIAQAPPHAIMLDLHLPGPRGEAFLARFRGAGGQGTPIVVVTVDDVSPEERAAFAEFGVVDVLRKGPGVAPTAAATVARALGRTATPRLDCTD
jgi:CheY-like chemotaxis protein